MLTRGAASAPASMADVFEEFARRYSQAERAHANARHTERGVERAEAALSMKQAVVAEFGRCFIQRKFPDWSHVESAARGEWDMQR